jgi:hypothetical protein
VFVSDDLLVIHERASPLDLLVTARSDLLVCLQESGSPPRVIARIAPGKDAGIGWLG